MNPMSHRITLLLPVLTLLLLPDQQVQAQQVQLDRGFVYKAEALASGDEQTGQEGLWVLEVQYKSLRMLYLELADPQTGKKRKEILWYLAYRILNRPLEGQQDESEDQPVNQYDKPHHPIFVPEFTLVTDDNGVQRIYKDEIIPELQAAINRREKQHFKNSVEIVGPLPDPTPFDAPKDKENVIYGVAMWRGLDPQTDFFTIYLSGFSNGYFYVKGPVSYEQLSELAGNGELSQSDKVWDGDSDWTTAGKLGGLFDTNEPPPENAEQASWFYTVDREQLSSEGLPPVWRKTLSLKYWRPGDRFRQDETEIRPSDEPMWIYRISEPPATDTSIIEKPPGAASPINPIDAFFKSIDRAVKSDD